MKIIQDLMTIIEAEEGYCLTNGQGIYGHSICLGINDSPSNWYEIKEEEVPPDELVRENSQTDESTI